MDAMNRQTLKLAFRDTIPVMTGYLFLGCGFGILLNETGYGLWWSLAMAVFMYAGSAQFLAVSLLANHTDLVSAAIATLLLNARHLFYGLSLIDTYKHTGPKKAYLIFALTDETYSLVAGKEKSGSYCLLVSALNHSYWVGGTLLGALAGQLIPVEIPGIEFVLTALFVTIFTEQWLSTKDHRSALIGVASTLVCLLIFGSELFLIPSMVIIALMLTLMRKTGRRKTDA